MVKEEGKEKQEEMPEVEFINVVDDDDTDEGIGDSTLSDPSSEAIKVTNSSSEESPSTPRKSISRGVSESPARLLRTPERKQSQKSPGSATKRETRTTFTSPQIRILEEFFARIQYPDKEELEELSSKTKIKTKKIQTWFQNQRARRKRTKDAPSPVRFDVSLINLSPPSSRYEHHSSPTYSLPPPPPYLPAPPLLPSYAPTYPCLSPYAYSPYANYPPPPLPPLPMSHSSSPMWPYRPTPVMSCCSSRPSPSKELSVTSD